MINGFEYAWEDIQVIMGNKPIPLSGITEIEYGVKKEHINIYGRGDEPVAMGKGKKEPNAKMVILQSEFEAMQRTLPKGQEPTSMKPFTIVVGYAPEGGVLTVDKITHARIAEWKKGMKTGDGNMTIELALVVGQVTPNV